MCLCRQSKISSSRADISDLLLVYWKIIQSDSFSSYVTQIGYQTMSERKINVVMLALLLALLAMFTLSPSVAFADVTVGGETLHGWTASEMAQTNVNVSRSTSSEWTPDSMADTIASNTGVNAVAPETNSSNSSSSSSQEELMVRVTAAAIGSYIFTVTASIIGIIISMLFIVLCGTWINYIKCKCERPSQAGMYGRYTSRLMVALGLTALVEIVLMLIWTIVSL